MPSQPERPKSTYDRILVVRTDRIGDVVLTLPVLSALRSCFPGARLSMLLQHYTGAIVQGHPDVSSVLWYDERENPIPFRVMMARIREEQVDAAVVVHPTLRLALLLWGAGVPVRVGTGYRWYSFLFNRRVYEHRKHVLYHEAEYNVRLLRGLGCEGRISREKPEFRLAISEAENTRVDELLQAHGLAGSPLVVIHAGSGGSARDWPARYFAALGTMIQEKTSAKVILTGGGADGDVVGQVRRSMGDGVVDLSGQLALRELAALAQRAAVVVANSTGPLHIAAAVGTPVVGLYPQIPAMSPRRWGPYTTRCRVHVPDRPANCRDCNRGRGSACACMESILPEAVFESVNAYLAFRGKD